MKKLLVLAMMATLLMAGSAFAINRNLNPVANATFSTGLPGVPVGPTTTNNDDSCDIGVAPAATLLLPYFEVDISATRSTTTLFTITNVSRYSQIAHVTVWTDWSFPVLDFNIFLTGYDVQAISMSDVLNGTVAPHADATAAGTGPFTPTATQPGSPLGSPNLNATPNYSNPNFATSINCASLPGALPVNLVAAVRTALTTGSYNPGGSANCGTALVGGTHTNAIGYVTIDVAASCTTALPTSAAYYGTDILFDNVLIGDYQQLGPAAAGTGASSTLDGAGNAMVHIRAVPEGGGAGSQPGTNLPYTFYDRYTGGSTANRTIDRRQPLPSTWAARYIQGGPGAFATNYKIWREGFTGAATCTVTANSILPVSEIVRFDEHENPFVAGSALNCSPCFTTAVTLPETSSTNTANNSIYPNLGGSDVGGWMYLNLNNGGAATYSVTRAGVVVTGQPPVPGGSGLAGGSTTTGPRPSQNWVVIEMFGILGSNRLSVDFDAAWLGNGCSQGAAISSATTGSGVIGPAGGVFVCPPGTTLTQSTLGSGGPPTTGLCTGTNTTPLP